MLPLSPNAAKAVEKLFFAEQRQEVVRLLTEKCADNLPNCKDQDEYGLEDRRFQVLKLSGGNIDKLHDAIRMANEDWRDVMLAAGSATAYRAPRKTSTRPPLVNLHRSESAPSRLR